MKNLIVVVVAVLTTGCAGTIDSFYNRQVVEDQLISDDDKQEIGTLAVTAQRRLIIANLKTGNFCSEPPPETADSITTALAAALKANIAADKNVSAELASNFARHVNQLYKRAHTIQLFRDAAFYLCVNAVNSENGQHGSYKSYEENISHMVELLKPSLDKEVALYYATEKARAENPPEVLRETIICNSSSTVDKKNGGNNKLSTSINCRPISKVIKESNQQDNTVK